MSARSNSSNHLEDFPITEFENLAQLKRQNHRVPIRKKSIPFQVYSDDEVAIIRLGVCLLSFLLFLITFVVCIVIWENHQTKAAKHVLNAMCRYEVLGDGICDDQQNHLDCGYDGLDCCKTSNDVVTSFCDECKCHYGIEGKVLKPQDIFPRSFI
jgi:hypothetical protein